MDYQKWEFILKAIAALLALVGAIVGAVRYFREQQRNRDLRREELDWRKAQFVFQLAQQFDAEEEYRKANLMIDFGSEIPKGSSLERVLSAKLADLSQPERECRYAIDHYLDFFDRLYHLLFVLGVLKTRDLECFTWYIRRIGHCAPVTKYAETHGYGDVLRMHEEFKKHFKTPKEEGAHPA